MDKPLPKLDKGNGIDKREDSPSPKEAAVTAGTAVPKVDTGGYNPELSYEKWQESQKDNSWDSSPQGRAAIRVFSRGVLGAAGFAFGSWYAGRGRGMAGYHSGLKFTEIDPSKPLQYIAKSVDAMVGSPIKFIARKLGASDKTAERLVSFRPTNNVINGSQGRSLGHETVSITFDFFCSSVADAIGRDLANIIDPNAKHDWKDEKGNINYSQAAKNIGKSAWRYVSYNGGEDWAVAVPYAYFMRAQRRIINRFSPGFTLDSERGLNGGSFKVNKEGQVTGNYNVAGMLDLQSRFTAYNVGTLMYRELYNHVDSKLHGKQSSLYGSPEEKKPEGILQNIGDFFKWGARSVVKGVIYMTPATPFFHIFRTSQSNYKGLFINPETEAALAYKTKDDKYDMLHANEPRRSHGQFKHENGLPDVEFRKVNKTGTGFETAGGVVKNHVLSSGKFNPYDGGGTLGKIGKAQSSARSWANDLPEKLGWKHPSKRNMDNYVNAAFAYTPYMYAKGEAARLWDSGKMDAAAERMIDGAAGFNAKEFKAGAGEVWNAILHKPFADPAREAYAQKRLELDNSPADNLTKEQALGHIQREKNKHLSWQERIIHGRAPEQESELKAEKQSNYAEQEAMRKALQELHPPTNSIH
jgi:hypothetical protein